MGEDFEIDGISVDGNDTPWVALGDLIINESSNEWIGMSFVIYDKNYYAPMKEVVKKLNKYSIVYVESFDLPQEELFDRINIFWSKYEHFIYMNAQLVCGQWFWWYKENSGEGDSIICNSITCNNIIAFSITDIKETANQFNLNFPQEFKFDTNLEVRTYPPRKNDPGD